MEQIGRTDKNQNRNTNIRLVILKTVATAGLLSLALLAPNAVSLIKMFGWKTGKRSDEVIKRARKRLIEKGLLCYKNGYLELTQEGEQMLRTLELRNFKFKKPKQWDKKWRVLVFDIPEKRRLTRDKIRMTLQSIGFIRLQDSVWIYPYKCEDLVTLLKADFKVGKDMLYLTVDNVENDSGIKKYFGLH
ncbi:MAG: CRISPR-associated endonuclease Cas2 [Patescibacteria group bacterium]